MKTRVNIIKYLAIVIVSVIVCFCFIEDTNGINIIRSEKDIRENITLQRNENNENVTLTNIDVSKLDGKKTYTYIFEKTMYANAPSQKIIHESNEEIKDVTEGDTFSSHTVYYHVNYSGSAKWYGENLYGLVENYICYTEIPYLNILVGDKNEKWVKEDFHKKIQGIAKYHVNYEDWKQLFYKKDIWRKNYLL